MQSLALGGPGRNTPPSSCVCFSYAQGKGQASVDLRDFESIPIFFSEEEIEEVQAAIDERRSRRLALEEERPLKVVEQSDYSSNVLEKLSEKSRMRLQRSPTGHRNGAS
jgi:hypothetical protein